LLTLQPQIESINMQIIDSHIHFYDLSNNINSWISNEINSPFLQKDHLPNQLQQNSLATVYGAIHVEAHDSKIDTIVEIEWLQNIMLNETSLQYKHIAFADITLDNSEFQVIIDRIKSYKVVIGIRHILSFHDKFKYSPNSSDLSKNTNIAANLRYLAKNNLIFDCQCYSYQLKNLLPLIIQTNITTIIDHLALPYWGKNDNDEHLAWQQMIQQIAKQKNIYLKLSGLDMFQKQSNFAIILDYCINNFPTNRLIYGSNNPVSFEGDYNTWYNYIISYCKTNNLTKKEQEDIFYNNAYQLFFK
jgi:L-fuconolactonase